MPEILGVWVWAMAAHILSSKMGGNDLDCHTQALRSSETTLGKIFIRQFDLWDCTRRNADIEVVELEVLVNMCDSKL